MSLIAAKATMRELAVKAHAVMDDPKMTQAEKSAAFDLIKVDIDNAAAEIKLHERMRELTGGEPTEKDAPANGRETRSFGRQVIESDAYKSLVSKQTAAASVEVKAAATIDEGVIPAYSGGAGLAGQVLTPQFLPGIVPLRFQPLTIADLIASGSTESASISYVIESAFQDLTGTVAEKGARPQLDLTLGRRQDNVTTIGNTSKITGEMFQDGPAFESYLANRMVFGVQRKEEQQLLNGSGTAPDLQGILNRTGLATAVVTAAGLTAVKAIEGIFNQITALRSVSFVEPDAFVIHPTDWQTIRLGKDGQGQYYAGGPFTGAYGNGSELPTNQVNLWGYKGVVTTAIAQGTVLVGGFQECAQVFRRQGIVLEMTNSNVDDFQNNLVTLRAQERLALAVYRPAGFGKVTLTA